MIRILVVDDHAVVRSGVRRLLALKPDIDLSEAANGEEAVAQVAGGSFQLVILDLNLPGLGGLELLRRLLRITPRLRVLVFSLHTEAIYATRAMQIGARGFVSKNAMPDEFLAAVNSILAGHTAIGQDIASEIASLEGGDNAYLRPLTQRDLEMLRLLADGNNLTQIAQMLGIAYKTVANTLSRIKEKLGVNQTADLIRIAMSRDMTDLAGPDRPNRSGGFSRKTAL